VRWSAYERLWRSRFRFYAKHRNHYPRGYLSVLRGLLGIGLTWRKLTAQRRFANGQLTGEELQAELNAYQAVAQL